MNANILLIEENTIERKRLASTFEGVGYRVLSVENLVTARSALVRTTVDLAVVSSMLDDGPDLDLLHWLRQQATALDMPVLVLANDSTAKTRIAARTVGANDYLARPFVPEYLLNRLNNLLIHRESRPSITPSGFTRRVLVVDDSPTYGFALTDALQKDGHDVTFAETGKEALAFLENHKLDAVVVDVFLPDINGVEVCRRIKANERTASLPVLVLTGREKSAVRNEAVEANADDFAVKSSDFELIRSKVRSLLVRAPNRKISTNRMKTVSHEHTAKNGIHSSGHMRAAQPIRNITNQQNPSFSRLRVGPTLIDPSSIDLNPQPLPTATGDVSYDAKNPAELLEAIVTMTGLSELVARSSVESACRRLSLDPRTLSRKDIPRVVESLERTLQLFLPETEAKQRLAALTALAK